MFGIGMISLLYNAHNAARGTEGIVDAHKRATAARPLFARLFGWARVEHRIRTDGDPMKTAVGYLVCQRRVLTRFLHLDFLDGMLAEEVDSKQRKRVQMGIQIAHRPTTQSLDDFDFKFQPGVDQKLIRELSTKRFVHSAEPASLVWSG